MSTSTGATGLDGPRCILPQRPSSSWIMSVHSSNTQQSTSTSPTQRVTGPLSTARYTMPIFPLRTSLLLRMNNIYLITFVQTAPAAARRHRRYTQGQRGVHCIRRLQLDTRRNKAGRRRPRGIRRLVHLGHERVRTLYSESPIPARPIDSLLSSRNAALGLGDSNDRFYPEHVTFQPKEDQESLEQKSLSARFQPVRVKNVAMSKLHTGEC